MNEKELRLWIARDKDGALYFYVGQEVPQRGVSEFASDCYCLRIDDKVWPEVTWENSPVEFTLTPKIQPAFDELDIEKIEGEDGGFVDICAKIVELHARKNHDYGNAFGDTYQDFAKTNQAMADGYAVGLLCNKVSRIKSLVSSEAQVKNESVEDSLLDLASYAIMTLMERRRKEGEK